MHFLSAECDIVVDDLLSSHFRKLGRKPILCGHSCEWLVNDLFVLKLH